MTRKRWTRAKAFHKDVFIDQERKLGDRRRSDTVVVSTINDADLGLDAESHFLFLCFFRKARTWNGNRKEALCVVYSQWMCVDRIDSSRTFERNREVDGLRGEYGRKAET